MSAPVVALADIETVLARLYAPQTTAADARAAQAWLQDVQRQSTAWPLALQLLGSVSPYSQFFGAQTLLVKISRDGAQLPNEQLLELRQELLRWMLHFSSSSGSPMVLKKICATLVALALRLIASQVENVFSDLIALFESAGDAAEAAFIEFLTILPEEVGRAQQIRHELVIQVETQSASMSLQLASVMPQVMRVLQRLMLKHAQSVEALCTLLRCMKGWTEGCATVQDAKDLMPIVFSCLDHLPTMEPAAEVMESLLNNQRNANLSNSITSLLPVIVRLKLKMGDHDEDFANIVCNLALSFAQNFTDYVAKNYNSEEVRALIAILLDCTAFKGYYPVDETISAAPLDFWYNLQDTIQTLSTSTEMTQQLKSQLGPVYLYLVGILRRKAEFPPTHIWNGWMKDAREEFKTYRKEIADTLTYCYLLLREDMVNNLRDTLHHQLASASKRDPGVWQDIEATLFCLASISMDFRPDEPVDFVFAAMPSLPSHPSLVYRALLLLGSCAEWLKKRPHYLPNVMCYILSALPIAELQPAAIVSLYDISEVCKGSLSSEFVRVVTAVKSLKGHCQPKKYKKAALAACYIARASTDSGVEASMVAFLKEEMEELAAVCSMEKNQQSLMQVIIQLQLFSAVFETWNLSDDDGDDGDDDDSGSLASSAITKSDARRASFASSLVQALWPLLELVAAHWITQNEVADSLSKLVESIVTLRVDITSKASNIASFVTRGFIQTHHPSFLRAFRWTISSFSDDPSMYPLLAQTFSGICNSVFNIADVVNLHPDLTQEFLLLLESTIRRYPELLLEQGAEAMQAIFSLSIGALSTLNPDTLKQATSFLAIFFNHDSIASMSKRKAYFESQAPKVQQLFVQYGPAIINTILFNIGSYLPRSQVANQATLLFNLRSKYSTAVDSLIQASLSQDQFPTMHATPQVKDVFVRGLARAKGFTRCREIVMQFCVSCRKLGSGAYVE